MPARHPTVDVAEPGGALAARLLARVVARHLDEPELLEAHAAGLKLRDRSVEILDLPGHLGVVA